MKHASLPTPSDFAAPPSPAVLAGWLDADRQARPTRLAALRERMAREGIDALMLGHYWLIQKWLGKRE